MKHSQEDEYCKTQTMSEPASQYEKFESVRKMRQLGYHIIRL